MQSVKEDVIYMKIKKIVAFGEILLRFTPQNQKQISEATGFDCFYGGSEANVSICLSSLGNYVSYITVLPENELGIAARNNLIKYGVDTNNIRLEGDILGSYYLNDGLNGVAPSVIYNRKGSEVSKASVNTDFDYDNIFENASLFHISGISFALSESCKELCFKFMNEARKRGILTSFDFNYRPKLWSVSEAGEVFRKILPIADIVFCSDKDIDAFFDGKNAEELIKENNCKYIFVRNRETLTKECHRVSLTSYCYTDNGIEVIKKDDIEYDVSDRVGSGDAFAAGMIHGLLNNPDDIDAAVDFALKAFIMKHQVLGDYLAKSEAEVNEFDYNK